MYGMEKLSPFALDSWRASEEPWNDDIPLRRRRNRPLFCLWFVAVSWISIDSSVQTSSFVSVECNGTAIYWSTYHQTILNRFISTSVGSILTNLSILPILVNSEGTINKRGKYWRSEFHIFSSLRESQYSAWKIEGHLRSSLLESSCCSSNFTMTPICEGAVTEALLA